MTARGFANTAGLRRLAERMTRLADKNLAAKP